MSEKQSVSYVPMWREEHIVSLIHKLKIETNIIVPF